MKFGVREVEVKVDALNSIRCETERDDLQMKWCGNDKQGRARPQDASRVRNEENGSGSAEAGKCVLGEYHRAFCRDCLSSDDLWRSNSRRDQGQAALEHERLRSSLQTKQTDKRTISRHIDAFSLVCCTAHALHLTASLSLLYLQFR